MVTHTITVMLTTAAGTNYLIKRYFTTWEALGFPFFFKFVAGPRKKDFHLRVDLKR
jgi:hypothetical protein